MAGLERIMENITNTQQDYMTVEDRVTKAVASAVGAFCIGFSAGGAAQVHYGKYLPKPAKALLVLPTAMGATVALGTYRHGIQQCERLYIGTTTSHVTPTSCVATTSCSDSATSCVTSSVALESIDLTGNTEANVKHI